MINTERILIAISGPTASGKSLLAKFIEKTLHKQNCAVICQDNYYKAWPRLNKKRRKKINFDNLNSFDWKLLHNHLNTLKNGEPIQSPKYDFIQSQRLKKTYKVKPKPFIMVEGLMPYFDKKLRNLFDYKIYIDTNDAICLARRLKRDIEERGDSIESVCKRYFEDVLPMQKKYVEPQKKWADFIINE